jgi:hypothetical protein
MGRPGSEFPAFRKVCLELAVWYGPQAGRRDSLGNAAGSARSVSQTDRSCDAVADKAAALLRLGREIVGVFKLDPRTDRD